MLLPFSMFLTTAAAAEEDSETDKNKSSMSIFPILMYDTDIGVGFGAKGKFVNFLKKKESFDLILFNSTKGERWYVFTFSIPDFEIRQGKAYPFSLDIKAEYDRFLVYYFYGFGPDSNLEDKTEFTNEKINLEITLGKGFSPQFILEGGYVLKNIRYYDVEEGQPFEDMIRSVGSQFSPYAFVSIKYDTSDSQIHPTRGFRLHFQNDFAGKFLGNKNASYHRFTIDFRNYISIFGEKDVFAVHLLLRKISGSKIPVFDYPYIGGSSALILMRGYLLNRFTDKGKILLNAEYRFPIWKRFGGNVFIDAGNVWPSFSNIDLGKTRIDAGLGLKYYLANFLVGFDMGFSHEGTGAYFSFNHAF
jgi:outer membrane protein assembly factor BamA